MTGTEVDEADSADSVPYDLAPVFTDAFRLRLVNDDLEHSTQHGAGDNA